MGGFYLEEVEAFKTPRKIYGNCIKNADRIISTFWDRNNNTGVLLTGEKGSGKTLLARQVAIQSKLPVIIVNSDYSGDNFNSFLGSISQPCIILIDEFEKVYKKESQEKMLTLLDGTYQSRKLFLFTSNDKWRIDDNMKNRPGRIFYLIEFGGLEEEFITEYCKDNLRNTSYLQNVLEVSRLFDVFNFDLLNSIVEESNRYNEDPKDLIKLLNAKPEYAGDIDYSISVKILNHFVPPGSVSPNTYTFNPSSDCFELSVWLAWRSDDPNADEILENIENNEVNLDEISEMLNSGRIKFWNRSKITSNPFGKDVAMSRNQISFECTPEDIFNYGNDGSVTLLPDEGVVVTLTKKTKPVNGRRF